MDVKERIGIYTGSFNPIHNAHLRIVEIAREALNLDMVFIEACNNHYKKKDLAPVKDRMKMIKTAIAHVPGMCMGDYEATQKDKQPYTIETLDYYKKTYSNAEIFYICGGDVMYSMHKFYKADELFEKYKVLCISRKGYKAEEAINVVPEEFKKNIEGIRVVHGIIGVDYSATAIRELVKKGYTIRWLVPEGVKDYIIDNNIYKKD
jgi:nicotinate-nucleotide adenylyltransferase